MMRARAPRSDDVVALFQCTQFRGSESTLLFTMGKDYVKKGPPPTFHYLRLV